MKPVAKVQEPVIKRQDHIGNEPWESEGNGKCCKACGRLVRLLSPLEENPLLTWHLR